MFVPSHLKIPQNPSKSHFFLKILKISKKPTDALKILKKSGFLFRFLRNETVLFSVQGWTIYTVGVMSNQS